MGLFREAGKKFEEAKRSMMSGGEVEYRCANCEEPVTQAYEHCPHCGEDAIESIGEPLQDE